MNKLKLDGERFPLTVDRIAEMQDTYMHISKAIGEVLDRGVKYNYILSGCLNRGDDGYVVYNGEIYNVVSSFNSSYEHLKLVTTDVTNEDNDTTVVVSTEQHFEWSNDGEIFVPDTRRLKVSLRHPDTAMSVLTTADSGALIATNIGQLKGGWQGGDYHIQGKYMIGGQVTPTIQLPASAIPLTEVLLPVKVDGEYKYVVPDISTGIITIAAQLDGGTVIEFNTVIDGEITI